MTTKDKKNYFNQMKLLFGIVENKINRFGPS